MGFDVSSHPVDAGLIQKRLLPYLRGEGQIDDLVADAVRLARVRFRANAWGLGLLAHISPKASGRPGQRSKRLKPAPGVEAGAFDPDLHLWGRPFFVAAPPELVGPTIDRYLAAGPGEVDGIAREQLDYLHPDLKDRVEPDTDGHLPESDADIAAGILQELDLLRSAYPRIADGRPVKMPDGEQADPEDLFLFHMPLAVVAFAAQLLPGWMGRGHVWPTSLAGEAGLDAEGLFEPAGFLFEPLLGSIGGWEEAFSPTITQNYTLGGAVRAANVPALRAWWQAHRDPLIAPFVADGEAHLGLVSYQKTLEAVQDAERRNVAFVEATEVYSGFMGIMN